MLLVVETGRRILINSDYRGDGRLVMKEQEREKEEMLNMGAIQFWNESVVYYRNEKDSSKTVEDFVDNMDMLKVCRARLAWVERKILRAAVIVVVLGSILLQGCKFGAGVGMDYEVFYPKIETSKGGKFGDPDESRRQSTQHTTGMARNNLPMVGGAE